MTRPDIEGIRARLARIMVDYRPIAYDPDWCDLIEEDTPALLDYVQALEAALRPFERPMWDEFGFCQGCPTEEAQAWTRGSLGAGFDDDCDEPHRHSKRCAFMNARRILAANATTSATIAPE